MPRSRLPKSQSDSLKRDRFKARAEARTKQVLRRLHLLGKCSNRQRYSYSGEDVEAIFRAVERKTKEIRDLFLRPSDGVDFKL